MTQPLASETVATSARRPRDVGDHESERRRVASTPNAALTVAYNQRGGAWKPRQLNQAIDRLIEKLVETNRVRPNLTIHGLRHARGVELALAGASNAKIMSQLEHATDRAAKIYRRQAERRKLADAAQSKIDKVVKLREATAFKLKSSRA